MSTILDYLKGLMAGEEINERCPECRQLQRWWTPHEDLRGPSSGLTCRGEAGCGFSINAGPQPPDILCSSCGLALEQHNHGFRCAPCGREVRP